MVMWQYGCLIVARTQLLVADILHKSSVVAMNVASTVRLESAMVGLRRTRKSKMGAGCSVIVPDGVLILDLCLTIVSQALWSKASNVY